MTSSSPLSGKRILVVEDEAPIMLMLADLLGDYGCTVVGPAYDVATALALIEEHQVDCGLLDIRLGNDTSYQVAETLTSLGIPLIFITGYPHVDARFRSLPKIEKPFGYEDIEAAIAKVLGL